MKRSGFADLPLHGGYVPAWLAERMTKLGTAIVESILALARTLKTSVVAEGIEEDGQAHELLRLGCTHA